MIQKRSFCDKLLLAIKYKDKETICDILEENK